MKKLVSLIFLMFFFSSIANAQMDDRPPGMPEGRPGGMKKIEQLEKIKLIEVLDMDEETTLKFFARRNAHNEKVKQLIDQSKKQLDAIDDKLKEKPVDEKELNSMIDKYFAEEKEIGKEKEAFIRSLSDILSVTQMAKLVVFEKKFRDEIRDILFKTRMDRRKH
jgi:septal ring factor EnvC (AmiA/AmiB activator)